MEEPGGSSTWTREQEKAFENALVMHPEDVADRWEKILAAVSGKTVEDIKYHYELLVEDIGRIELGRVPFPSYVSFSDGSTDHASEGGGVSKKGIHSGRSLGDSGQGGKASRSDQERRKGIAWTEDEHRLFLLGLDKYGKGDWRSISRNFVISRTPTQVASHAQKYFIRLNSMNRDRRRSSIHDITSVDPNGDLSSPGPITGQTSTLAVGVRKFANQSPQQPLGPRGIGAYGATAIGQPVGGSLVSAGGAPVNIPALPCMAYGFQAPVPGVPMNFAPVTYPMPHSSAHR